MSSDAGSGVSEDGQEGNENGAGAATGTATAATSTKSATASDSGFDAAPWEAFAKESGLTVEQLKAQLGHARKWEDRAKANKNAADELGPLRQQVDEMKQALADRDVKDIERAGRLAIGEVRSALATARIEPGDVEDLLAEIEPTRLLKDGEPDEAAIKRVVSALRKAAGRPAPDADQGQKGSAKPSDMNSFIRRAAGVNGH